VAYSVVVVRHVVRQTVYQPDFADWMYFVLLPVAAYAILVVSAFESVTVLPTAHPSRGNQRC